MLEKSDNRGGCIVLSDATALRISGAVEAQEHVGIFRTAAIDHRDLEPLYQGTSAQAKTTMIMGMLSLSLHCQ